MYILGGAPRPRVWIPYWGDDGVEGRVEPGRRRKSGACTGPGTPGGGVLLVEWVLTFAAGRRASKGCRDTGIGERNAATQARLPMPRFAPVPLDSPQARQSCVRVSSPTRGPPELGKTLGKTISPPVSFPPQTAGNPSPPLLTQPLAIDIDQPRLEERLSRFEPLRPDFDHPAVWQRVRLHHGGGLESQLLL